MNEKRDIPIKSTLLKLGKLHPDLSFNIQPSHWNHSNEEPRKVDLTHSLFVIPGVDGSSCGMYSYKTLRECVEQFKKDLDEASK